MDPEGPGGSERHGDGGSPGHRGADAAGAGGGTAVAGGGGGGRRGAALGVLAVAGSLLAAAMRGRSDDGEAHAVAAFRAARDGGAHTAPTRRRDDWRHRRSAGATGSGGDGGRPRDGVAAAETADAADFGVPDTEPVAARAAVATTEGTGAAEAAGVPRRAGRRTD
ncbi:hypothetical protein ACFV99_33665 [Streptomyces sp. NPDC059944]|uniref:hypothetical protein n=1 Tax=unclassified Streptomyces TaxID=2593676 RepID=UPI00366519A7